MPRKPGTLTAFWYAGPGVHFVSPGLLQLTVFAKGLMSRLQSLQNAAARLVSDARRYDHITPVLLASATEVALASSSTSGGFQDGYPGLPVTVQHGSTVSVSWSLTKVVVSCVLPHQGRAL